MIAVPRVSVIVPTYNRADLLPISIRSVLSQTLEDYEVMVVDDGSTDDTSLVVEGFTDARVRYFRQANQGLPSARNTGLRHATGQYIAFLDSDDLYEPRFLEHATAYLDAHDDVGLVSGGWRYIDKQGRYIGEARPWEFCLQPSLETWLFRCHVLPCSVLLRRCWLDEVGGFDPAFRYAEDWELWLRLTLAGCRLAWIPEMVCGYRLHSSNQSSNHDRVTLGNLAAVDKLFAQPSLPPHIRALESAVRAHVYLRAAPVKYAAGLVAEAQADIVLATQINPGLLDNRAEEMYRTLVGYAGFPTAPDRMSYMRTVFDHIPDQAGVLRRRRREALAAAAAGQIFSGAGGFPCQVGRLLFTILANDARWLKNRGLWSIVARHPLRIVKS